MTAKRTKVIWVFTHGEKIPHAANPSLSENGKIQIFNIKKAANDQRETELFDLMLKRIEFDYPIVCGTGNRHLETAKILGLEPTAYSPLAGCPDSSDMSPEGEKIALLSGNQSMPITKWMIPNTRPFLFSLEDNTILVAGRPFMLGLGYTEAKEGMIIKITTSYDKIRNEDFIFTTEIIADSNGNLDIH